MDPQGFLSQKIGPLPLVAWVGIMAGGAAILVALRAKTAARSTSTALDMLSPSSAEAFGTLQQQQEDLSNALNQLGIGQGTIIGNQGQAATGLNQLQANDVVESQVHANPSLLDQGYQKLLVSTRGWVFYPGEPHGVDGLPNFYGAIGVPIAGASSAPSGALTGV